MSGDVPGLVEVLKLLAGGVGVGAVIAFLFERFRFFQDLTGEARWWVIFGCSVGLPVLAQVGLEFVPGGVWAQLEPYWRALAAGFLTWAGSQVAHLVRGALKGNG